jgi:hypothetical protein
VTPRSVGILVSNYAAPDAGGGNIEGCVFDDGASGLSNYGVYQTNGGGLRIQNTKFLGFGVHYVYELQGNASQNTSILLIQNNSFEHARFATIEFLTHEGTSLFGQALIQNNQFTISETNATGVLTNSNLTNRLYELHISGNEFNVGSSGGTAVGIGGGNRVFINNNAIWGQGGTSKGIIVGVAAVDVYVGVNVLVGLGTATHLQGSTDQYYVQFTWTLG